MQDLPRPETLVTAVAAFLRAEIAPQIKGAANFQLRVAINALELVARHLVLGPSSDAAELKSLERLLGRTGSLEELNAALCAAIAEGSAKPESRELQRHLWSTTMAKLAVDQPSYATYKRALAQDF
ncbi:MAG: hypothetical protein J2P51_14545 [Hyphomicrobiaceae bacterium]|nr:hypothetical protein [Hyphomicrobiaceae bacterium]